MRLSPVRAALLLLLAGAGLAARAQDPIDLRLAARYFGEAKNLSDDDAGGLWGKRLYGPMLFVDPQTRAIVANQADVEGKLAPREGVFVGTLPPEVPIANTATKWAGVHWTMIMWPLPKSYTERARLMMHECWHRIQEEVGLPGAMVRNAHLDTEKGRLWLRLEWRALQAALLADGEARRRALADALVFRAYRRSLFPDARTQEDRMEVHEGMAEYTGIKLRGTWEFESRAFLSSRLSTAERGRSYTASFAYQMGPAYGLLLDTHEKPWRSRLTPRSSLSDLARETFGIPIERNPGRLAASRARAYAGAVVAKEEAARERTRATAEADYRKRVVDGPVLELPQEKIQFSYNPNEVFPMGDLGTIYPSTTISDVWGTIIVQKGARITPDFKRVYVSAPLSASDPLRGDGWTLTLKPGWRVVPGKRKGDFTLERIP